MGRRHRPLALGRPRTLGMATRQTRISVCAVDSYQNIRTDLTACLAIQIPITFTLSHSLRQRRYLHPEKLSYAPGVLFLQRIGSLRAQPRMLCNPWLRRRPPDNLFSFPLRKVHMAYPQMHGNMTVSVGVSTCPC